MSVYVKIMTPRQGQEREFTKYTKSEIEGWWDGSSMDLDADNTLVVYPEKETDAVVLAALFMRELDASPIQTKYLKDEGALLLNYGHTGKAGQDTKRSLAITCDMVERVMGDVTSVSLITKDKWGESLFAAG